MLVLIVIILLFVFGSGSDDELGALNSSPGLQEKLDVLDQASKTINNEPSKGVDEDLCEDYYFDNLDTKTVSGHTVEVLRIATKGAKIEVDGEEATLFEGDSEILGDDFRVELKEVFYFGSEDNDNMITLRLGCEKEGENSNDKYIRNKGENICENLYQTCKDEFDLE